MKIVSWNVRGLVSSVKRAAIKSSLRSIKGYIFIFQETKMEFVTDAVIHSLKPFGNVEYVEKPLGRCN